MTRTQEIHEATGMQPVSCAGCGKMIFFATTADGKHIPLDPSPPVYEVSTESTGRCERSRLALVSHFATCSGVDKIKETKR